MADGEREHHWHDRSELEERLVHAPSAIIRGARGFWAGFQEFLGRDNVLEVAVGLMIASSFTAVVNALVSDILLPPLALLPFLNRNLESKFAVLRSGPHGPHYNTLQQAADDGAVTLAWGLFVDKVFAFLVLGLVLYGVALLYGSVSKSSIIRHTARCAYCRKLVSEKAVRCPFCSSWLDGREEKSFSALEPAGVDGLPSS